MRRYTGGAEPSLAATRLACLTDLESREALDHHPLARLRRRRRHELLHLRLARRVLDEGLLEQTRLREKLLELPLDDLVDDLGGLLLIGHLLAIDLALLLEDLAGDVFTGDV